MYLTHLKNLQVSEISTESKILASFWQISAKEEFTDRRSSGNEYFKLYN